MKLDTLDESFSSMLHRIGIPEPTLSTLIEQYENVINYSFGFSVYEFEDKFIFSFFIEGFESLDPITIVFTKGREGWEYKKYDACEVKEISDEFCIYEINDYEIIFNDAKGPDYYREYWPITKQGLINNHGDIIYKGDLGDSDKITIIDDYVLLEKDKFSKKQKEQIDYYFSNYVDYDNKQEFTEKADLLAALDFEQVFNSKKVAEGKYITSTWEEYNYDYSDMDDDEDERWWNLDRKEKLIDYTVYTDVKSYSVIDLKNHRQLFPFQPCKINITQSGKSGIYLANEIDIESNSQGYRYDPNVVNKSVCKFSVGNFNKSYFYGQSFYSACDTFRAGPDTGRSLASLFKQKPRTVIKYVLSHDIFITKDALLQLEKLFKQSHKRTFCQLVSARERCFDLHMINSSKDRIYGNNIVLTNKIMVTNEWDEESIFHGKTLRDILTHNPEYLISLIDSDYYFIHPDALEGLEDLPCFKRFSNSVINIHEIRQDDLEWRREMAEMKAQRDFDRMEIETGWQTAFGDDPESEWNID